MAGPDIPAGKDTTKVTDNAPPITPLPKFFKPSFSQTMQTPQGLPAQVSPAETKLGKLVHIVAMAGQGALAGWGTGNPAAGADRAREIPIQNAEQRQQLQAGGIANQQAAANLRAFPLTLAQRQAEINQILAQTQVATQGTHSTEWQQDPNNLGGMVRQSYDTFGRPVGSPIPAVSPYLLKPKIHPVTYVGDDGQPHPGSQNLITGDVMSQDGSIVPNARVFESSMVPKSTTDSSSTDLMGNTTSRKTTAPVVAPTGNGPAASPTSGQRPVNMVQRTAGGPLVAQSNPGGPVRSQAKPNVPAGSMPANDPVYGLAPDVEQRLQALAPPAAQGYLRAILQYKGQLPSNRGKSASQYAQDVDILTKIDPSFNAQNYDLIRETKAAYAAGGKNGQQVLGFNTALRHMGMLNDAAAALNNGNIQLANRFGNALSLQFGSDKVSNFNTIKTYLGSELAKGFGGGVATDSSRAEAAPLLSQIQSPEQLAGGFKTAADLLRGKIGAMESAYSQPPPLGTGQKVGLLDDESHGVLQKLGLEQPQMLTLQDGHGHMQQILASDWKKNQAAILRKDPGAKVIQ
jgi:hypothetical protein